MIKAYFNVIGKTLTKTIPAILTPSDDTSINIIQIGRKTSPTIGTVFNNCPIQQHSIPNTKVTFFKSDNQGINAQVPPHHIIYEYCYTNDKGQYCAFLETGQYKVRIEKPYPQFLYNINITNGIEEYYSYTNAALIKAKIADTIVLYGTDKVQVQGSLYDEYNKLFDGQIIITQNNELIAFVNTVNGHYRFLIDYGIYDIRLKSKRQSVHRIVNFNFQPGMGFLSEAFKTQIYGVDDEVINNLIANNQLQYTKAVTDTTVHLR